MEVNATSSQTNVCVCVCGCMCVCGLWDLFCSLLKPHG